jgi:pSer/pThr/pTyr-binding forkhead associated (FHA) protein
VEIPTIAKIVSIEDDIRQVLGISLVCQKTKERIEIPTSQKTILGREHSGREVFTKLLNEGNPIVSRKHCSIEYSEGHFHLLDEGSLNGTFYGVSKLSCKERARIIEENSLIFIGKELFVAEIRYKDKQKEASDSRPVTDASPKVRFYRCNDDNCTGYESPEEYDYCPKCNSYKNYIKIY